MTLAQTTVMDPERAAAEDPARWLTPGELARWAALPSLRRRRDRLAGRIAVKRLLLETFGLAPHACEIGTDGVAPTAYGAEVLGINLSLSHSHGLGAASWAATATQGTVGVDAQHIRPVHGRLAARVLAAEEQAQWAAHGDDPARTLILFWALKEAAIKARRRRWTHALSDVVVRLEGPGRATVSLAGERADAAYVRAGDWWLARALLPPR